MTRHLVSNLDKRGQLMLRDELLARLAVADAAADAYAEKNSHTAPDLLDDVRTDLRAAALAGFGFAVEEVRNVRATEKAEKRGA